MSGIGGLEVLAARIAAAARDPSLAGEPSSFVNKTSIGQSLESIFCFFPTGEVAPGDIWKAESTLGGQPPSVTRYVFTDVKNKRGRLTEKVEGRVEPAQAGGGANLRGAISGEVEVDADTLRVLAGSIDQELSGIIVVHGVSMPMEVKTLRHSNKCSILHDMFNSIPGRLSEKRADTICIETGGVEWELAVPARSVDDFGRLGDEARAFAWLHHYEDGMRLYGFPTESDRSCSASL